MDEDITLNVSIEPDIQVTLVDVGGPKGDPGPMGPAGTTDYNELENLPTLGTAAAKDIPATGNASATEVVYGTDTRLTDSRPASDVSTWAKAPSKPTYTKSEVGLSNADDTSDANKPISTATQTALDTKASTAALDAHANNTSNPHAVTKAQVGLSDVDNTSDANKPVSTAQQAALDGKFTQRTITGTTNQITVTNGDGVSGNPTLALPQDIHTGASPTFAGATLTNSAINTGDGVIDLITTKGLQIRNASSTATFRLLPVGNDVYFQNTVSSGAIVFSGLNAADLTNDIIFKTTAAVKPQADSVATLGTSSLYWKETYTDKLFLNSTATLDGSTAGEIKGTGIFTADNIKRGTGFPEGVVTANVGTVYIDTAITNGASSWVKKSGTGSTGWWILEGDTGWRSNDPANSWFLNGATPGADGDLGTRFRREGNVVHCVLCLTTPSGWTNGTDFLAVPNGFRTPNNAKYMPGGYAAAGTMSVYSNGTSMRFYSGVVSSARFQWTWITNDPWPTTLPGIAA